MPKTKSPRPNKGWLKDPYADASPKKDDDSDMSKPPKDKKLRRR